MELGSLTSDDVFVLDAGLQIWVWNGSQSNHSERKHGTDLAKEYKINRGSKPEIIYLDGLEDDQKFWEYFGGKPESIPESKEEDNEMKDERKLFKLSDESGKLKFEMIASGENLKREMLDSND